jgi:hypothetical protein
MSIDSSNHEFLVRAHAYMHVCVCVPCIVAMVQTVLYIEIIHLSVLYIASSQNANTCELGEQQTVFQCSWRLG